MKFFCGVSFTLMLGNMIAAEEYDTKAEIESLKRRFDNLEASLDKVISIFHSQYISFLFKLCFFTQLKTLENTWVP